MIFKTLNGDLTVFNKTLISTKDHLKSLQAVNATVYNKNGVFNLQGLLVNSSKSVSTFTKLNNAFKAYNGNLSKSAQLQNAYVQAVGKQNVTLGNYLAGLNGAKASMGGYVKSLVAAKAASIGLQIASVTLNTAISMGITLAISALVSAITKWVSKEKEAREEAIENAKAAKEEANNLSELLNKYNQLSKEVKSNQGVKENLLSVQSDLLEALGIEASQIDTLIEKYGDLDSAINQITLDSLRDAQGDLMVAVDAYEKELINVGKGYAHWYSFTNRNMLSAGRDSVKLFDILEKAGIISSGSYGEGGGSLILTGNDKTVEGVLENYQKLKAAQEALNTAIDTGEVTMEEMISNSLYKLINARLDELKNAVDNYDMGIDDINETMAQQQILKSLAEQSSIPETKEEFEAFQQSMIDTAIASTKFKGSQDDIRDSIINVLSVMPEFKKYFEELYDVQGSTLNKYPISSTITSSIEQLATQLEPQFSKLEEAYREIFTADGFTLNTVDNSMLENLRTAFTELEEEVGVTFDASVLNPFFDTLTNKASTVEQVQDAFNNLATAYFYSTETLEQLNEETATSIEKQLEEMGVVNASEVVYDALNAKTEALALQKQFATQTGYELANATTTEITSFLNHAGASETARAYLFQLITAEQVFNNTDLSTAEKIEKLKELATAYGQTAIAARIANMEKAEQDGHIPIDYEKELAALQTDINNAVGSVQIDFNSMGGAVSHAADAGKSAAESYIDAFAKELSDLSQLRDNGVITEKEYLDSLRALYERYFANKLGYEKEYAKYQRQYLEGYKSLYESALSGISTLLGNQIDGYKDAKDAAVSSLTQEKDARLEVIDAQKEQLEAQKDLIDEQIEAKQKLIDDIQNEIDAMKEANSERQRQLDLQKAQYELERMQHQRTILQYSEENGMQYVQNDEGLRTAKENVDNAKFEIEISNKEKNISLLEDEISLLEEQKDAIQNQMDLLDKQADQIESYYSKMISETEAYYDSLINNMERQKSKWEEIAEIENIARAYSDLEQVAGGMGYSVQDILSGNEQAFEDFKSRYIALLSDLNNNSSFLEGLSYATSGIAQDIDNLEASAATVSESTGKIAANIGEVNINAEALSSSLSNINDSLSGFSETDNITAATDAFSKLGQAIQSVADALNISEDGTIGSLTGALKSLCEMPLCQTDDDKNGGILSKFQALKTAVTDVTSAISGGGSSASDSGDGGNSSSPGTSSGAAGNSSGGLAGAIASLKSAATDALGGNGNDESEGQSEGSGIIAQFGQLKNAVTDTTEAIGSGDSKQKKKSKGNSKNGNLISSITSLGSTTSEILTGDGNDEDKSGGVIGRFEQFKDVIGEANEHVTGIATGLHDIDGETVECTIKVNVEQNGELPAYSKGVLAPMKLESGEYKAKYGRTFAKGSGNYKGLPKSEKNALRSEYGQPELTVYPDGTTELTTQPTISDLPKGTVIFNEAQTKEIFQNKGDSLGGVSSSGSTGQSSPGKPTLPPPQRPAFLVQQELQEECLAKTGSITDKILSPLNMLSRNWKDMAGLTGNINHINHNGQNQSVNVGGINITCPGVTSQEVARQLGTELNHIFSGFHNYADQQSRVR